MMWERYDVGNSLQMFSFLEELGERYRRANTREFKSVVAKHLSRIVVGRQLKELLE
jgi:hypothetical protein